MSAHENLLAAVGFNDAANAGSTPEELVDAHRLAVIADRDAQIVVWLAKKAREEGTSNKERRTRADAIYRMADKLSRGAVRPPLSKGPDTSEADKLRLRIDELERAYTFDTAALKKRVAELEQRLHDAAMARVWTNEDGKKFVFADDLKGPLLGTTPVEVPQSALRGRARLDAKTVREAEATHWKRLGMTPPAPAATGGAS